MWDYMFYLSYLQTGDVVDFSFLENYLYRKLVEERDM